VSGSHDARNAAGCAAREKLSFHLELISDIDLVRLVGEAVRISSSQNPVKAAYTVPIVCVIERSRQKTILTGSGADELFGGYAKYVSAEEPGAMMAADLEKIVAETSLLSEFALRRGKRLCSPFLSDAIVEFSRMIGPEQKISGADRKTVLRAASKMLGLESYGTPKKAAQYSSGVLKRMQRLAKAEGLAMDEWVARTTRS
jgi:asparagine synthase (glutamine-hydrolysing)